MILDLLMSNDSRGEGLGKRTENTIEDVKDNDGLGGSDSDPAEEDDGREEGQRDDQIQGSECGSHRCRDQSSC